MYYSLDMSGREERLTLSMAGEETRPGEKWGTRMANMDLGKLESGDYVTRPYTSRAEYIELLMAIVRAPKFADAMNRRYRDSTTRGIIYRAMDTKNAEYLAGRRACLDLR